MTRTEPQPKVSPEADTVPQIAGRTFAIGDLHGEITLLRLLFEQIQPTDADTLIFLGDYVDRGEDSVAVCEELLRLRAQLPISFVALRGNHDAAWLEVWTGTGASTGGGYRTCPLIPGARAIWTQYHGTPPLSIGRFLETTVLTYEDAYGFYCHAGITPGKAPQAADEEVYLWGSGWFFRGRLLPYPKPIVCGRYELPEPLVTAQRICLDTAAYRTGVLTALQMETRTLVQVTRSVRGARDAENA